MKNCTIRKPLASSILMMLLVLWQFSAANAQPYNLPITGSDALRCGAGQLTLAVTWSGGVALNPDNVKWYTVPFYGTPIASGMSYTTPYIEFTQVFYVDYIGEDGCSQCDRLLVRAVIADQVITPQVIYPSLVFCNSANQDFTPTVVGASGGVFSISPAVGAGSFSTSTGTFNPSGLTSGIYVVTFTPTAVIGCNSNPVTVNLTVTNAPVQPTISYAATSYCSSSGTVPVSQTGATGGSYSASPSGLTINSSSGMLTPSTSQSRSYTVTYLVPGGGGCAPVWTTTEVSILKLPTASISYAGPFTQNQGAQQVTLSGTDDYLGGSYSSTAGLTIDAATGEINPSTSNAGVYTVTYTKANVSPCTGNLTATKSVEIFVLPLASISAGTTEVCVGGTEPEISFTGSLGTPPYTFGYKINNGIVRTVTSEASSVTAKVTQPSGEAGTYTYALVSVTDSNGSLTTFDTPDSEVITIIAIPSADFVYLAAAYCPTGTATPELSEGAEAGTFTASPTGLVFTDQNPESLTGTVDLANSTPGIYIITHAINICGIETATTTFTVFEPPTVDIVGNATMTYGAETTYSGPEGENYAYQWEVVGVATITSSNTARSVVVQATGSGQFELILTVIDAIGCTNSITKPVDVHKAELLVTADDFVKGVGEVDPAFTVYYSGFVNSEDESILSGTYTVAREVGTATGTYTITPSGNLSSDNYHITYHTGTLTIANVVVEATLGTPIASYANLSEAFGKINDGTHKGEITISIYADLTEPDLATELQPSGVGAAEYTSVTIVAANNVTVTGGVIIGGNTIGK